MMNSLEQALCFIRENHERYLEELKELLRIPSISTLPEHAADVAQTAEWLGDQLCKAGISHVEILPTGMHPVVYAEGPQTPGQPTVLVYGHYDVQPVDPIDEWNTPPFEPTIVGENMYARGISDMKSQIFGQIKAVEALSKLGPLPVNLKYLLEGEEEIGSPNLPAFLDKHRDQLKCDVVLNCDAGIHAPDIPGIIYALRGLAYFEIEVRGPSHDLHSGMFGGIVHNPIQVLCALIAGMHDANGHITLPGFYDSVASLSEEEKKVIAQLDMPDETWKAISGAPELWGEKGYTTLERVGARPSLDVNGIVGGFTGHGAKTVLPAKAGAKLSMRLLPSQDPAAIHGQLLNYMEANAPQTVTWTVRELSHGPGAIMDLNSKWMKAAKTALTETFGVPPVFKREGGSVPVVGLLQEKLGVDSIMLGFALPSDGIHGPNEKQHLGCFFKGIETYARFMTQL